MFSNPVCHIYFMPSLTGKYCCFYFAMYQSSYLNNHKYTRRKDCSSRLENYFKTCSEGKYFCNNATLQHCNIATLQHYNIIILQNYNITIIEYHNITILQYYNITISQYQNTTISQYHNIIIL